MPQELWWVQTFFRVKLSRKRYLNFDSTCRSNASTEEHLQSCHLSIQNHFYSKSATSKLENCCFRIYPYTLHWRSLEILREEAGVLGTKVFNGWYQPPLKFLGGREVGHLLKKKKQTAWLKCKKHFIPCKQVLLHITKLMMPTKAKNSMKLNWIIPLEVKQCQNDLLLVPQKWEVYALPTSLTHKEYP